MGTVSGAAEVLGVHHATVIRHIDALEASLGVKLFQRHPRGYTATEAGTDLLRVAQAADEKFTQLAGRIRGSGADVSGDLLVTSPVSFGAQIAPLLVTFQQLYPDVSVHFLTSERLLRLEYGEAHVALRAGKAPDEPDNVVQHLVDLRTAAFASAQYVQEYGKPDGDESFIHHRFVGSADRGNLAPFNVWMGKNIADSAVTFRCTDQTTALAAVKAGAGIGFFRQSVAGPDPDLIEVCPPRPEWGFPVWLVTHVDLHRTTKVQALVQYIKEHFEGCHL